jgi:BTB/POZ domain
MSKEDIGRELTNVKDKEIKDKDVKEQAVTSESKSSGSSASSSNNNGGGSSSSSSSNSSSSSSISSSSSSSSAHNGSIICGSSSSSTRIDNPTTHRSESESSHNLIQVGNKMSTICVIQTFNIVCSRRIVQNIDELLISDKTYVESKEISIQHHHESDKWMLVLQSLIDEENGRPYLGVFVGKYTKNANGKIVRYEQKGGDLKVDSYSVTIGSQSQRTEHKNGTALFFTGKGFWFDTKKLLTQSDEMFTVVLRIYMEYQWRFPKNLSIGFHKTYTHLWNHRAELFTDLKIQSAKKSGDLHVHRGILHAASLNLKSQLGTKSEIILEYSLNAIEAFCEFIYTGTTDLDHMSMNDLQDLFRMSQDYKIDDIGYMAVYHISSGYQYTDLKSIFQLTKEFGTDALSLEIFNENVYMKDDMTPIRALQYCLAAQVHESPELIHYLTHDNKKKRQQIVSANDNSSFERNVKHKPS